MKIFGVPFQPLTYEQALEKIRLLLETGDAHQVCLVNAHTMNLAYSDTRYRKILKTAAITLRDGIGVKLAGHAFGAQFPYNFVGTDFVPDLLSDLQDLGISLFLYGAKPGVAAEAARVLRERAPRIRVLGTQHGYVDPAAALEAVNAAAPDLLLVALGNPLQEQWIADNLSRLNARVSIGVGALFDYLAGRVPRAPKWVQLISCEWLFRLYAEPRRLWRRYLVGNPLFLWRLAITRGREPT